MRWCHETLLPLLPSSAALVKILRKLLILEPPIAYPAGEVPISESDGVTNVSRVM